MVIVVGNWKMYKTVSESVEFVKTLAPLIEGSQAEVWLAVPYTAIAPTAEVAEGIVIGAQNMNDATEGAFTGEIAARMLLDVGARFVVLGHSERRHVFGEGNDFIRRKLERALSSGLRPILCVGETLEEREAGQTEETISRQLKGVSGDIVLAYEPVWAIGTDKAATPEMAQEVHSFCRTILDVPILYGGSVKPENAEAIMAQSDIDGLLVGGASLDPKTFASIIKESSK